MSCKRIHWHPPGYVQPRPRCGVWSGTAAVTRDKDKVTCKKCRLFIIQAMIGLEPIRGRPLRITYYSGETEEGLLLDGTPAGLTIYSRNDGKPFLAPWTEIATFGYLDEDEPLASGT